MTGIELLRELQFIQSLDKHDLDKEIKLTINSEEFFAVNYKIRAVVNCEDDIIIEISNKE